MSFKWTEREGLSALAGGWSGTGAWEISADGSVVVGNVGAISKAWRWTAADGMKLLPPLPGYTWSNGAGGTNGDGSAVVGYGKVQGDDQQAYLWTVKDGIKGLGFLSDTKQSGAGAIARDAMVVVGGAKSDKFDEDSGEAFVWTPQAGMFGLGTLPGDEGSAARDTSADGRVVIGVTATSKGAPKQPFRWTESGGMVGLGFLPGGKTVGVPYACSGDGSRTVGSNSIIDDPLFVGVRATVWDAAHGVRSVTDILAAHGVDTGGLILAIATDVSADGTVIVGYGTRFPEGVIDGWVARIPPLCRADCDINGELDIDDFICFQGRFAEGHIYADCDIDGILSIDDFICFQTWFATGCP